MKIGYLLQQGIDISRPPFDGPANHVREVIEALTARGHTVRVVMNLNGHLWQADGLAPFERPVVRPMDQGPLRLLERVVRRAQSQLGLPYAGLFESCRFALACRQALAGFDVLFERWSWMGYGGGLAARWLRRPLVIEYNGDHLHDLEAKGMAPKGLQRKLSLALMEAAVRRTAHVVATGNGWREHFVERHRYPADQVSVIENGTALVRLLNREQLRAFQASRDPNEPVTFVYLGGFYPWHGVQVLIRAFADIVQRGAAARLLLIGSGFGLDEARQLVADWQLNQHVTFTGQLAAQAFAPYLAQADVGLSPYCGWKEFSGLKLFDYKAAGLATIASGMNGQPPTLKHNHTALIVPPCDKAALAEAMFELATDPERRQRLGQAARLEAEQCHGWDHTAAQLEQVFRHVTGVAQ